MQAINKSKEKGSMYQLQILQKCSQTMKVPRLWLELFKVWKINHFKQVCRHQHRQVPKEETMCREVDNMCQDNEKKEVITQEFDVVRSTFFNFYSIRSDIIAKLK